MPHRVKILAQNIYVERVLCTQLNGIEGRLKEMACTEIKWNIQDQKGNVRENISESKERDVYYAQKWNKTDIYSRSKNRRALMHRNDMMMRNTERKYKTQK